MNVLISGWLNENMSEWIKSNWKTVNNTATDNKTFYRQGERQKHIQSIRERKKDTETRDRDRDRDRDIETDE